MCVFVYVNIYMHACVCVCVTIRVCVCVSDIYIKLREECMNVICSRLCFKFHHDSMY